MSRRTRLTKETKKWVLEMRRFNTPYKQIQEVLRADGIEVPIGTLANIVWAGTEVEIKKVRENSACDHTTSSCDCIRNSPLQYTDYLRNAGYRVPGRAVDL